MGQWDFLAGSGQPLGRLMPDFADREREQLQLENLRRQGQIHDLEFKTKTGEVADEDAYRRVQAALLLGGYNPDAIRAAATAEPRASGRIAKSAQEHHKAQSDLEHKRAQTLKEGIEAKVKAFDAGSSAAQSEYQRGPDHLSMSRVRSVFNTFGYHLPGTPPPDDAPPEEIKSYLQFVGKISVAAKEQLTLQQTGERDAATDARGKATLAQTIARDRGVDEDRDADRRQRMAIANQADARARDTANKATWSLHGYDPVTREPVWVNPRNPQLLTKGESGMVPYAGSAPVSPAEMSKQAAARFDASEAMRRAEGLERRVAENPNAFSTQSAFVSSIPLLPRMVKNPMINAMMTGEERVVRTEVMRDAAVLIHEIYGAAVTGGEKDRAAEFAPSPDDDFETTMVKLAAAKRYAAQKASGGAYQTKRGATVVPGH